MKKETALQKARATGTYTDRSPVPIPVHSVYYPGCTASNIINKFINAEEIRDVLEGGEE